MNARLFWCLASLVMMPGCVPDSGGGSGGACTPGELDDCACPDGTSSQRTCGEDDRFGPCACGPEADAIAPDAIAPDAVATDMAEADMAETDGEPSPDAGPTLDMTPADAGLTPDAAPDADLAPDAAPDMAGADAAPCAPVCGDRTCGDDGCGGLCGVCEGDDVCADGRCAPPAGECGDGVCEAGEDCSSCGADCGCPEGQNCVRGACEAPDARAPVFLTLNTNVRRLTEGERVVFSAVVTDPDGIDDLIGGVLEDPNGQSYGAFVSSGQEGAYSMTLSWGEIHAVDPIEFDASRDRNFVAVFFDQGGLRTQRELIIELHCDGIAACDGACVDFEEDGEHCGRCRVACADDASCTDGACACDPGFFGCGNDLCVPEAAVCDRADDCGDGSDEAGCCFADADCPLGERCGDDRRCAPGCPDNSRCPADRQCRGGACVPGCGRDADCFAEEYCGGDGRCALGCRDDVGCGVDRICEARVCIDGCREDAACPAGSICEALNCVEGCRADPACPAGSICEALSCVEGCRADPACPVDRICEAQICVPGCQADAVCARGTICTDRQCRPGCNAAQPCPEEALCVEGDCVPRCFDDDANCAQGEYCREICRPHVCGDAILGPDEECDPPRPGCSAACALEGDDPRAVEGDEPYLIEFDGPGRAEVLVRIDAQGDTDAVRIVTPAAGVLYIETRAWHGEGCVGDTILAFTNAAGGRATDDDSGAGDCARLAAADEPALRVEGGAHSLIVSSFMGRPTGYNRLIVEYEPPGFGGACVPAADDCPAGGYCIARTGRCGAHRCGDDRIAEDVGEQCEDGNAVDGDGCTACRFDPFIGADDIPRNAVLPLPRVGDRRATLLQLRPFNTGLGDGVRFRLELDALSHVVVSVDAYPGGGCPVDSIGVQIEDQDRIFTSGTARADTGCIGSDTRDGVDGWDQPLPPGEYLIYVDNFRNRETGINWLFVDLIDP